MVHFAVDDHEVAMCTALKGTKGTAKDSWFLPFNQGWNDGAGNPPNPDGIKTDYLWRRILTPARLTEILENYAQIVEEENPKTGKKKRVQIFPRYHQLDVVRKLLADVQAHGAGKRYLIQHSAGSGKSNSIAWLAHQLIGLREGWEGGLRLGHRHHGPPHSRQANPRDDQGLRPGGSIIGAVKEGAGSSKTEQLSKFLKDGKKLIISTVQTFPFVLDSIGEEHRGRKFAIIIDEAHSSQGGRTSAAMSMALSRRGGAGRRDQRRTRSTASSNRGSCCRTPATSPSPRRRRTRRWRCSACRIRGGDEVKHRPFHSYTMKQAIQEGFILDVLKNYTPVDSYYRLAKTVEGDPGVRREEGAQEAAPLRGEPRAKPSATRRRSWWTISSNR